MGSFEQYIYFLREKSTEGISFMALKSDIKFAEKLTCDLKNDMRNSANFHENT